MKRQLLALLLDAALAGTVTGCGSDDSLGIASEATPSATTEQHEHFRIRAICPSRRSPPPTSSPQTGSPTRSAPSSPNGKAASGNPGPVGTTRASTSARRRWRNSGRIPGSAATPRLRLRQSRASPAPISPTASIPIGGSAATSLSICRMGWCGSWHVFLTCARVNRRPAIRARKCGASAPSWWTRWIDHGRGPPPIGFATPSASSAARRAHTAARLDHTRMLGREPRSFLGYGKAEIRSAMAAASSHRETPVGNSQFRGCSTGFVPDQPPLL